MSFLIGFVLALGVGFIAYAVGLDRERAFFPTVTIVIGTYYVLFAVMAGSVPTIGVELVLMLAFAAAGIAGFRTTQWVIVAALAGHGLLDLVHGYLIDNPGVPGFWPGFCLAFDVVLSAFLACRLLSWFR